LPLTTLGQETRWAYSTPPPNPHGAAGHEIAEYENDGHEIAGQNNKKMQFSLFFIFVSRNSVPCYMVRQFLVLQFLDVSLEG